MGMSSSRRDEAATAAAGVRSRESFTGAAGVGGANRATAAIVSGRYGAPPGKGPAKSAGKAYD